MGRIKSFLTSPKVSLGAFVLAMCLLAFSSIGGARAALTYYSENYVSQVQMQNIGVSLLENGSVISSRDYGDQADGSWEETKGVLLAGMVPEGEKFKPGKVYPEELCVRNTGGINEYVRVSIYKYWRDAEGDKAPELSPDLIELNLTGNGWIEDTEAKTRERTVLYYGSLLGTGETSTLFADTLCINSAIATKVQEVVSGDGKAITSVYAYNGMEFCVEAKVDAVQEHNAADAIKSAWGRNVTVNNGSLSLN